MEGSEDRAVVPGHFDLPLPSNTESNIDKNLFTTKLTELQDDLRARRDRPEELAIQNVMGVLSFRIKDYEGALGYFEAVLSKDKNNLNALANKRDVYKHLTRTADAKRHQDKLDDLLQVGELPPEEVRQRRYRKARCLAEHAYAFACDIHIDRPGEIRYDQSNYLYDDAFTLGGDLVDTLERDNWKFCKAKNAHKIVDFCVSNGEYAKAASNLESAVNLFFEVTQSVPGDPEFKWESWRHLADLIRATKVKRDLKGFQFRDELQEHRQNPEMCMKNAAEIAPDSPKMWARYANFVHSLNKMHKRAEGTKRAKEMLQRSIHLDSSKYNFYAFSTRGRITLDNYRFYRTEFEKNSKYSHHPAIRHLEDAKQDLETSLAMRETPWDFSYLSEIYHLRTQHPEMQNKDNVTKQDLEKAILYSRKALDCQNGENRREVHLVFGHILFDMGDLPETIQCFKKAVELEPKRDAHSGNFTELLKAYLHRLRLESSLSDGGPFLDEMVLALKTAQIKYGRSSLEKHTISKLKSEYLAEIKKVAEYCERRTEHKDLVPLLTSVAEKPPFSIPVHTGRPMEEHRKASSEQNVGARPLSGASLESFQ
ncbi:uncharacterized protein LOC110985493 [Acanthaster planci]|uniref:Uncharacterized protein LOC110985493 n=1 Tax=Acanthaster planci TaxID=133434 RepID=A0A8B7ZBN8_ACAPL|nr:uncharacterized protein LOC110985493 [Acanthaster planci]